MLEHLLIFLRATNFDPDRWEEPEKFIPERFLGYDQPAATYINIADPTKRDHWSYGAGRRVCPGVHVAEKSLFINIARLIWGFTIKKKVVNGEVIEPDTKMVPGWLSIPGPFECDIKVRSKKHEEIIRGEWAAAATTVSVDSATRKWE